MSSADEILSTKPVLLAAPGFAYNDLYYSKYSSSISLLESTSNYSNVISLSSMQFGSSSQVFLPIDQFITHVILRLRLPAVVANQTLCRGFGYACINNVAFTMGASSSVSTILTTDAILQTLFAQCKNAEMRDELLKLGGPEQLVAGTEQVEALVLLPLPFSTLCSSTLPVDTTMLSNSIQINITFNQANSIYGGTGARPSQFLAAELSLHQLKLTDQQSSLRSQMIQNPGLVYNYPFIMHQQFTTPSFAGHRASDSGTPCQVLLQAFGSGDLLGITMWVVADKYKAAANDAPVNPWICDEISDLQILFNGSQIFRMNGKAYKLANMLGSCEGAGYYDASLIDQSRNTNPFTSNAAKCYPIFIDFSRLRSACQPGEHQWNVWKLLNQNLTVLFNTTEGDATSYKLYAVYHYNADIVFADGVSSILV